MTNQPTPLTPERLAQIEDNLEWLKGHSDLSGTQLYSDCRDLLAELQRANGIKRDNKIHIRERNNLFKF